MVAHIDFNTWTMLVLVLVIVVASLLLFREWYRADREVKRLRRRVAELEQQASPRPAELGHVTAYDTTADQITT